LAKNATELEPAAQTTALANHYRQIRKDLQNAWVIDWAKKPNRLPPSRAGSHAFRTLDRRTIGTVTQARTGHGHVGEYYQIHNISEPISCPCGAATQTHEHIAFDYHLSSPHWHIVEEEAPDYQLTTLLGTREGIQALTEFVRESGAFQKPNPQPKMLHSESRTQATRE